MQLLFNNREGSNLPLKGYLFSEHQENRRIGVIRSRGLIVCIQTYSRIHIYIKTLYHFLFVNGLRCYLFDVIVMMILPVVMVILIMTVIVRVMLIVW